MIDKLSDLFNRYNFSIAQIGAMILFFTSCPLVDAEEIIVAAASSLKHPFTVIGKDFLKQTGTKVLFSFGASGQLSQQIKHGAPIDVFASAGSLEIDALASAGLVASQTQKTFAGNTLVVITNKECVHSSVKKISDLMMLSKIAIGNPESVPSGRYAKEALEHEQIYAKLKANDKFIFAENVTQAMAYVERDEVDAGIVYATEAKDSVRVKVIESIPSRYSEPIVYPACVLKTSSHQHVSKEFVDFLFSRTSQRVLKDFGFTAPSKR